MNSLIVEPLNKSINCIIDNITGDKSISHRCAIFSLLSDKKSVITNYLRAEDTMDSLNIAKKLGAKIIDDGKKIVIEPPENILEPNDVLNCGNAGTGMRLYVGFLSGLDGSFVLTGDKYLNSRPMKRVVDPLRSIGAKIDGVENGNKAPLHIRGNALNNFKYISKIDSAQIKSALILSALKANDTCYYKETLLSRDHTERMLIGMGADISTMNDGFIKIEPMKKKLKPLEINVPSDPSSAFFFAVAAAIIPESKIVLKNISLNETRIEAYKILEQMGTKITYICHEDTYEPIGDIVVEYGILKSINIFENIAWLIDELPALSIVMSISNGISTVKNAKELRVKESDRIKSTINNLKLCSVNCEELDDGYIITGSNVFNKATINSYGDHRIAMSFAIAGLMCGMDINDTQCIDTSFPNFNEILENIRK